MKRIVLASVSAALAVSASAADAVAPPGAAPGLLERPSSRSALLLSVGGAYDRSGGAVDVLRSGSISARGSATIATRTHVGLDGTRTWGLVGAADARVVGLDLPVVEGTRRFFRFGLSLGGFYVSPGRNLYWLDLGAFVAEQGSLLGSPAVHPRAIALGTHRTSEAFTLLYGVGYTHNYGLGLPLPFLGAAWKFAPAWRLDVLLPVSARVTWRVAHDLSVGGGTGIAGDAFGYQPVGTTSPDEARTLRIARLRLGVFGRYALSRASYLRLDAGVEGTRVDTEIAVDHLGGGYVQLALGLGSPGPAAYGPHAR